MSCSSIQSNFEKELNYNSAEKEVTTVKGMDLNHKFLKKVIEKKVIKVVGDLRGWDKIFRRIALPPIYPPDIIVSDPEGEVIESYTFNTPLTYEIEKEMTLQDIRQAIGLSNDCESNASSLEDLLGETKSDVDYHNSLSNDYESNASSLEDLSSKTKTVDDFNETEHAESNANNKEMYDLGASKQFLKLRQKKLKRLCAECKDVKFAKGKLKACNKAKLAKNELWKNEIVIMKSISTINNECVADTSKEQTTLMENTLKEYATLMVDTSNEHAALMADTLKEQATLMEEFLEMKDSTEKMLKQSRTDIRLNCEDVERKIKKVERKLKQAWRIFGKQKLRVKLAKYEYMRGKYGEMLNDITAKLESEITSVIQFPAHYLEERLI